MVDTSGRTSPNGDVYGPLRALGHGLTVLMVLSNFGHPASLNAIAEHVELHRSTVHRILSTLIQYGLARKDDQGKYAIGLAALELARAAGYTLIDDAPISHSITNLHLTTRARAIYAAPRFGHMDCIVASQRGEVSFPIVPRHALLPFHSTAAGKAYLAYRPEIEIEEYLKTEPFPSTTVHTTTTAKRLRRSLKGVRKVGHATEIKEFTPRGRAVGVPVQDPDQLSVASVALGLPDSVTSPGQVEKLAAEASATARQISEQIFAHN